MLCAQHSTAFAYAVSRQIPNDNGANDFFESTWRADSDDYAPDGSPFDCSMYAGNLGSHVSIRLDLSLIILARLNRFVDVSTRHS